MKRAVDCRPIQRVDPTGAFPIMMLRVTDGGSCSPPHFAAAERVVHHKTWNGNGGQVISLKSSIDWPLFEAFVAVHTAAGLEPPARVVFILHEIADEDAAIALIKLVQKLATRSRRKSECQRAKITARAAQDILEALDRYRSHRDWQARPAVDPLAILGRSRDKEHPKLLSDFMRDPDVAQRLLAELLVGARRAGVIREKRGSLGWIAQVADADGWSEELHGDKAWAFELAKHPSSFWKAVKIALKARPVRKSRFDLIRRLRLLREMPTRRRLEGLLRDASEAGEVIEDVLRSALRCGARKTVYRDRELPETFLGEIRDDPERLLPVISRAHELLSRGLHGQGRIHVAKASYCDRVAAVFEALAGKEVGYTKSTPASREPEEEVHGIGLTFMRLAMCLIDGATTPRQAQREIDRIHKQRNATAKGTLLCICEGR